MTTYYVSYEDPNGDNMDLFVVAETPQGALEPWKAYYEHENLAFGPLTTYRSDEDDYLRIYACPPSNGQRPGPVSWDAIEVWYSYLSWE